MYFKRSSSLGEKREKYLINTLHTPIDALQTIMQFNVRKEQKGQSYTRIYTTFIRPFTQRRRENSVRTSFDVDFIERRFRYNRPQKQEAEQCPSHFM